jgi:hypothetical protein
LDPPFKPPELENFADKRSLNNDPWMAANLNTYKENQLLLRQESVQNLFNGYFFDKEQENAHENTTIQVKPKTKIQVL